MSNKFREQCKLPEVYKKALDELTIKLKKVEEELEKIKKMYLEQYGREMTESEIIEVRKKIKEEVKMSDDFVLTEADMPKYTNYVLAEEQEEIYMQFIKEQAKGFFLILELIREQIMLSIQNGDIVGKDKVRIYARIKGIESALKNEETNEYKLDESLKILDDIFALTIVADSKKDVQVIRQNIFDILIKRPKTKKNKYPRINKTIKDKDGIEKQGYSAYHEYGFLTERGFRWIENINIDEYRRQVEECLGEENNSSVSIEELDEIANKTYTSPDELPMLEFHFQTEEEYIRANGIASHTKYKKSLGMENEIRIRQKFLHEDFHRFVDIPLMFEWDSRSKQVRLLGRDETLFTMYPYLKQLQAKKEEMTH